MEFLKQKWSLWFKTLDVNHDGSISRADVDQTLKTFPTVGGLSEREGKLADDKIEKWWNTYILKGKDAVTEDDFIKDLESQYMEDKDKFLDTMRLCCLDITLVIDSDHTNTISVDNYVKVFKAWGYNNEALIRKSFEIYKPDHGMVSVEEYTNDWLIFVTNEDPTKQDVVFETHKQHLIL